LARCRSPGAALHAAAFAWIDALAIDANPIAFAFDVGRTAVAALSGRLIIPARRCERGHCDTE
jgi:hypothetical protein